MFKLMRLFKNSNKSINFYLSIIVSSKIEHLFDFGNNLSLKFMIDQLIKGNIYILSYFI